MNRFWILLVALFFQAQFLQAQNRNTYEFVRVPEGFDFLREPNQHELNALTAFLLEKYGYEALYKEPVPEGISGCDVLQANVENNSGLFVTRLQLVFKNCADEVVFTSEEGKSREKDYKKAYHEALRSAFESLQDVQLTKNRSRDLQDGAALTQSGKASEGSSGVKTVQDRDVPTTVTSYTNGATTYRLEKTTTGYELYREGVDEKFATLLKSGTGDHFIYTSEHIQGTALFDEGKNLIVEYLDKNSGQLSNIKYSIKP